MWIHVQRLLCCVSNEHPSENSDFTSTYIVLEKFQRRTKNNSNVNKISRFIIAQPRVKLQARFLPST